MQTTTSPLNYEQHKFKSICLSCLNYEFGFVIIPKVENLAEHICHADCEQCKPGDCVIWCDHYDHTDLSILERIEK